MGLISRIELNDWNIDGLKSDNLYFGTGGRVDDDDDDDDVTGNVCWIEIGNVDEVVVDDVCCVDDNWW